jgi:hypothetical protein
VPSNSFTSPKPEIEIETNFTLRRCHGPPCGPRWAGGLVAMGCVDSWQQIKGKNDNIMFVVVQSLGPPQCVNNLVGGFQPSATRPPSYRLSPFKWVKVTLWKVRI